MSLGTARLGIPESFLGLCHALHGVAPTQSLLIRWLIVEGSAARYTDRLLVPGAPPPWDAGKLQTLSCLWGCWSLVPTGVSCAGNIQQKPHRL